MPFKAILLNLIDGVPGARGAILADWEGEAVDQAGDMDDFDLKVVGAHHVVILDQLGRVLRRLPGERMEELVVTAHKLQTLVFPVTEEYFLIFTLEHRNHLGLARVAARRCLKKLKEEIG